MSARRRSHEAPHERRELGRVGVAPPGMVVHQEVEDLALEGGEHLVRRDEHDEAVGEQGAHRRADRELLRFGHHDQFGTEDAPGRHDQRHEERGSRRCGRQQMVRAAEDADDRRRQESADREPRGEARHDPRVQHLQGAHVEERPRLPDDEHEPHGHRHRQEDEQGEGDPRGDATLTTTHAAKSTVTVAATTRVVTVTAVRVRPRGRAAPQRPHPRRPTADRSPAAATRHTNPGRGCWAGTVTHATTSPSAAACAANRPARAPAPRARPLTTPSAQRARPRLAASRSARSRSRVTSCAITARGDGRSVVHELLDGLASQAKQERLLDRGHRRRARRRGEDGELTDDVAGSRDRRVRAPPRAPSPRRSRR